MKVTNRMSADARSTVNVSDRDQAAALACAVTKMQYEYVPWEPMISIFLDHTLCLETSL